MPGQQQYNWLGFPQREVYVPVLFLSRVQFANPKLHVPLPFAGSSGNSGMCPRTRATANWLTYERHENDARYFLVSIVPKADSKHVPGPSEGNLI